MLTAVASSWVYHRGSRRRRRAAAFPALTARLDADTGWRRPVLERRHEVSGLAGDRDPPGRRVRGDDLRAQTGRGRHEPLTVRAGEQDAELVGERDERVLRRRGRCLPPRRSRRRSRTPRVPHGARTRAAGPGWRPRACTRTRGPMARPGGRRRARPSRCRGPAAVEIRRADLAGVARRRDVVQRDEPELARVARRPRDDHAARLEQGGQPVAETRVPPT